MSLREWCSETVAICGGAGREEFMRSRVPQLVLSKSIERIGEISGRIMRKWPDFVSAQPELRLRDAYAMRRRLVHHYEGADPSIVWATATISVPLLHKHLHRLLAGVDDQP